MCNPIRHPIRILSLSALALSVFLAAPVPAAPVAYHIDLGVYGRGDFVFDANAVVWVSGDAADGGVVALTNFSMFNLSFDGTLFTLADLTGQGAWVYGDNAAPDPDRFAGLDISGAKDGDSIAFTPGFGLDPNDLGEFQGHGDRGDDTGPVALTMANLFPVSVPVPEPEPWLVSLAAFAVARRWRRRGA